MQHIRRTYPWELKTGSWWDKSWFPNLLKLTNKDESVKLKFTKLNSNIKELQNKKLNRYGYKIK